MKNKNKNILITGVGGFIGAAVAREFYNKGFTVIGIDDLSSGRIQNVPAGIDFIKTDLSQKKNFKYFPKKCLKILHLAGQSSGEISFDNPEEDLNKNTISTLNLINYGMDKKVERIVYASSMSVYGNYKKKASEKFQCNPLSCYGISKLAAEKYLKIFQKKLPFISIRMFNVYGPGQDLTNLRQGMISIYLSQLIKKNKVLVKGSKKRVRDFIFIDDVVKAWYQLTFSKKALNMCLNLGTGKATSVERILKILKKNSSGSTFEIRGSTPGDQNFICSNNQKLRKILNFKKFTSVEEGIEKFISHEKK